MTEEFLQFIWRNGLFDRTGMVTDQLEKIEILSPGEPNADAGPDFLNARIRIGQTLWAGNVEVHVRSSDWYRHKHHQNRAFDSVILQVVHEHDRPVLRTGNEHIPTAILRFDPCLYENFRKLTGSSRSVPCRDRAGSIEPDVFEGWIGHLVTERLQQRVEGISQMLSDDGYDWENAFYVVLSRSFGYGVNSLPFEMLARSLPLSILDRYKGDLHRTEALLFGQSGLLGDTTGAGDDYMGSLQHEYSRLKQKHRLEPLQKHLWKFLRVRPVNFPSIRISQLAVLLNQPLQLFSKVLSTQVPDELFPLFDVKASEYWETHYTFGKNTVRKTKRLGMESIRMLLINAVIPFLFIYGHLTGEERLRDRALDWLLQIPPERNRVVNRWKLTGFVPSSAFHTQGLIQLTTRYCNRKRCLACTVGTRIIRTGLA